MIWKTIKFYYQFIKINNNTLSLKLTDKCNLTCEHCCVDASPSNNSVMVDDIIIEITKKSIGFSVFVFGGEPMLYPEKLKLLSNGMKQNIIISTNGFWGGDKDLMEYVKYVIKPKMILLSMDYWHQKFINVEKLIKIQEYFANTNIIIGGSIISKPYDKKYKVDEKLKIPIMSVDLLPIGRAKNLMFNGKKFEEQEFLHKPLKLNKICKCDLDGFIVTTNGDIYADCYNDMNGCILGNVNDISSFSELKKNVYRPQFIIKEMPNTPICNLSHICKNNNIYCMDNKWKNKNWVGVIDKDNYTETKLTSL